MSALGFPAEIWALLPLATAAGLDLYLTLLFLGAAVHLGWDVPPPGALDGLQAPGIVAVAAAFYVAELAAERFAPSALLWNTAHGLVRPLTAALLALLLLHGAPVGTRVLGFVLAAAVVLAVHAVRMGGTLVLWLSEARRRTHLLAAAAEDAMVLALCVLLLDQPVAATVLALALLVGALPQARAYADGFRFGLGAAWGRTWGVMRTGRWLDPGAFPGWVRGALREDPRVPGGPLRGSPAGASGLPGAPVFALGWFVVTGRAPLFVHRSRLRPRVCSLESARPLGISSGFLGRRVDLLRHDGAPCWLHFPPHGPGPEGLSAELRIEPEG